MDLSIEYHCRHCGHKLGKLGLEHYEGIQANFTEAEKENFVSLNDDQIHVMAICENCYHALEENPHYYEYDTFLQ